MNQEQIHKRIEIIENKINALKENRCDGLICITDENQRSLQLQELMEEKMELYYKLNNNNSDKKNNPKNQLDEIRHQEKINIAKNLLDLLDDSTISTKTGLSIDEIKQLRK